MAEANRPQLHDACALQASYLRLYTHTQNMKDSLLIHSNNCYANVLHCYLRTLTQLLLLNIHILTIIVRDYLAVLKKYSPYHLYRSGLLSSIYLT